MGYALVIHPSDVGLKVFQTSLPLVADKKVPVSLGPTTNGGNDGIFGWYRYIQDFTGEFALKWLDRIAQDGDLVWEPFSGSGTTLVAAKLLGYDSVGYDISPFMVDVARTKVDWTVSRSDIRNALRDVLNQLIERSDSEPPVGERVTWGEYDEQMLSVTPDYPADPKLRKWIAPRVVSRVVDLLSAVDAIKDERVQRFLRLAVASVLIPASNMTFRPNICYEKDPHIDFPVVSRFEERMLRMLHDYTAVHDRSDVPLSAVHVGDARTDGPEVADVIFTSPPYPNDMEYVHQTRLELTLLNYVEDARGLTGLKKQMISSSVKLVYRSNEWQKDHGLEIDGVREVYAPIAKTLEGRNWGWNAADMTAQYFGGMRTVLRNWSDRLAPDGLAAVVIGDSAFNGVKVPSDVLLAEAAQMEGLALEDIEVFRSRWNTKHNIELRESVVLLRKLH